MVLNSNQTNRVAYTATTDRRDTLTYSNEMQITREHADWFNFNSWVKSQFRTVDFTNVLNFQII